MAAHPADHEGLQRRQAERLAAYRASADHSRCQLIEAAIAAALSGATLGDLACALLPADTAAVTVSPVQIHRGSEIFESLRRASEAYRDKTGSLPSVFLANMGPIPQHKARADFATGFFEVGGFAVLKNDGFPTVEEAARAAADSGAPVVVICSTDDTYPEMVPPLTKLLKEARSDTTVLLAGYPADRLDAFRQAGVDDFIHMRADCYQLLLDLQKQKGVV